MIRRNSSVGRSTARAWYSLFSENATIQTGNVTNASVRCMRWAPSSCSGRTIACHTKAKAMPRATVTVSARISRWRSVEGATVGARCQPVPPAADRDPPPHDRPSCCPLCSIPPVLKSQTSPTFPPRATPLPHGGPLRRVNRTAHESHMRHGPSRYVSQLASSGASRYQRCSRYGLDWKSISRAEA